MEGGVMFTEKQRRELHNREKYYFAVKQCALDILINGEDIKRVIVSHSEESAEQFIKDVHTELEKLKEMSKNGNADTTPTPYP
jgi:hypothetical protein